MAEFSNIGLTNIDWDLTSTLAITEPNINSVTITASTFRSQSLVLPRASDTNSQNNLGRMYVFGNGVIQDYKEAVKWWRLAVEKGHAEAQTSLGMMYELGWGVIKDKVIAHMWHNISASNGSAKGIKNRDEIVKQMTASQIEEAQRLARQCQRNEYKGC